MKGPGQVLLWPGVRAVRAGSIGRDGQRLGESADPPQGDAGDLGPRPLHEEIIALWFQADRPAPQGLSTSWPLRQTLILAAGQPRMNANPLSFLGSGTGVTPPTLPRANFDAFFEFSLDRILSLH
jgi:hypothetical protein